jgi:L-threonylcarbamoyladenylate synthase
MNTAVVKVDPQNIDLEKIRAAAGVIKKGGIVGFPTETVYGLAADYSNKEAIDKIFSIKRRPQDKPLTVQIENISSLGILTSDIPVFAYQLMSTFWPGPLTMVFNAVDDLPAHLRSFQSKPTVGVRIPDNKIAKSLIQESQTPIVAPSANISGQAEAKTAQEVLDVFDGLIEMVIDGGGSELGVASTVLDLSVTPYKILREGAISIKDIESVKS